MVNVILLITVPRPDFAELSCHFCILPCMTSGLLLNQQAKITKHYEITKHYLALLHLALHDLWPAIFQIKLDNYILHQQLVF